MTTASVGETEIQALHAMITEERDTSARAHRDTSKAPTRKVASILTDAPPIRADLKAIMEPLATMFLRRTRDLLVRAPQDGRVWEAYANRKCATKSVWQTDTKEPVPTRATRDFA